MQSEYRGIRFDDKDIVNPEEYEGRPGWEQYASKLYLFHEEYGHCIALAFGRSEQDAIDEIVNAGKLDYLQIHPEEENDREDYMVKDVVPPGFDPNCPEYMDKEGNKYWWREGREPAYLGNACEPFDLDTLGILEIPIPPFSFCALFNAYQSKTAKELRKIAASVNLGPETPIGIVADRLEELYREDESRSVRGLFSDCRKDEEKRS